MMVQKADLGWCDARVLKLHRGALFAAQNDVGRTFDANGTGPTLYSFEGIFDLEDVAVWREYWGGGLAGEEDVVGMKGCVPERARS